MGESQVSQPSGLRIQIIDLAALLSAMAWRRSSSALFGRIPAYRRPWAFSRSFFTSGWGSP